MDKLNTWFDQINAEDLHPSQLLETLLAKHSSSNIAPSIIAAGRAIAAEADKDVSGAYHNYIHTSEAMASMYELASIEFAHASPDTLEAAGVNTKEELIVLAVITMAGHDLQHDGRASALENPSTNLEEISAAASHQLCNANNLNQKTSDIIKYGIEGTIVNKQVSDRNINNYETNPSDPKNAIAQLATEADLAASISMKHGVAKGALLSQEVKNSGNEGLAKGLASFNGRKFFLENLCHMKSRASHTIGLEQERSMQVSAMTVAQEQLSNTAKDLKAQIEALKHGFDILGPDPESETLVKDLSSQLYKERSSVEANVGTTPLFNKLADVIRDLSPKTEMSFAL